MQLGKYIHNNVTTVRDLIEMGEERAVQFDFLTQGDEPDRCDLSREIYHRLFPWYDEEEQAGNTLNTYRIAIKKYYGKYYRYLSRNEQLEVIEIIKNYTPHNDTHIFEFEEIDSKGHVYHQICNNYQVGNFGILPIHGGINPKRATSPYLDFFDSFLIAVYGFYNDGGSAGGELSDAIQNRKDYFDKFESAEDFVDQNLLSDYFCDQETGKIGTYANLGHLSESQNFEAYVESVSKIVAERGKRLWRMLANKDEPSVEIVNRKVPSERHLGTD